MGFASKEILANLDKKYSSRNPQYLMDGKRMIDEAVAKAEVDKAFLDELCKLKAKVGLEDQGLAIAVAILTSLGVSFAVNIFDEQPFTGGSVIGYIVLVAVTAVIVLMLCCKHLSGYKRFLRAYLLHQMEEKLDEDAHLHTDDKDS